MKVILLEKIHNLGKLGDTVDVKPGYGRNYLVPQGKAIPATAENLAKFEERRAELEKAEKDALSVAERRAEQFKELEITITAKALDEGKLFGSVSVREIAEALTAKGIEIEKREINMPLGPIHEIGEYDVEALLHGDVKTTFKVKVDAE